jgi:very-long-chain (3R)-3-hydroxyacyl-CoA dehydratase
MLIRIYIFTGLVRAPLFTTLMQVASRLLLVWGIGYNFPETTKYSPAYSSMLVAWSVTEVVRYYYFVFMLLGDEVPPLLTKVWTWLRYVFIPPFPSAPPPFRHTIGMGGVCKRDI